MKILTKAKDGGKHSTVTGYFLIESKKFITIAILRFDGKSRNAYHTHAFNCLSVVLKGELKETMLSGEKRKYKGFLPFITRREDFHKVDSVSKQTWIFTIRGPWQDTWKEFIPKTEKFLLLTHGRKIVSES